jgi:NAD(P)H-dependent FMN reductase
MDWPGVDAFIFVVAECKHHCAVLKNALGVAYNEWDCKFFTANGYGAVGGAKD